MGPQISLRNTSLRIPSRSHPTWLEEVFGVFERSLTEGELPLRFAITQVENGRALVEATLLRIPAGHRLEGRIPSASLAPRKRVGRAGRFCAVQVVPTGVRCAFGGYAGDATPVTNLLAGVADELVTHPNAVNASDLNEMAENVAYVEGGLLDDFLLGRIALRQVSGNRIGTLVDRTGIDLLDPVRDVMDAATAVGGIDSRLFAVLDEEIGVELQWSESGCAQGTIRRPEALLRGAEALLARGVEAIGAVSVIHGVTRQMFDEHLRGELPNPSGGVEAILTHMISKLLGVPSAHAPLPYYSSIKERSADNPRAAAEFISVPHYFSVLKGLSRAPRPVPLEGLDRVPEGCLSLDDVGAIVVPATCLGGVPALVAEYSDIPLIAVRENDSVLSVDQKRLGMRNVVEVDSYLEAAGVIVALRRGLALDSLRRPLRGAVRVEIPPGREED